MLPAMRPTLSTLLVNPVLRIFNVSPIMPSNLIHTLPALIVPVERQEFPITPPWGPSHNKKLGSIRSVPLLPPSKFQQPSLVINLAQFSNNRSIPSGLDGIKFSLSVMMISPGVGLFAINGGPVGATLVTDALHMEQSISRITPSTVYNTPTRIHGSRLDSITAI